MTIASSGFERVHTAWLGAVEQPAGPVGGGHAQRDRHDQGHRHAHDHQLDGHRQALDDLESVVNAVSIPVQAVGGLSLEQAVMMPKLGAPLVVIGARPAMGKCVAWDTPIVDPTTGAVHTAAELHARGTAGDDTLTGGAGGDRAFDGQPAQAAGGADVRSIAAPLANRQIDVDAFPGIGDQTPVRVESVGEMRWPRPCRCWQPG